MEKYLVGGAQAVTARLFGKGVGTSPGLRMLRPALEHAVAGGASGAVVGALDAGLKGAMAGKTMDEIETDMKAGFLSGLLIGGTLGAAGGAFEGYKGPAKTSAGASAGDTKPDPAVSVYLEIFPQHAEAEDIVKEMWPLYGGQGDPPDIRIVKDLKKMEGAKADGIAQPPEIPGKMGMILLDDGLDSAGLRETIAHEAWHMRVRQIYPQMYYKGVIHRNFIALDETAAHALEVFARGRPQSLIEMRQAIADIWNAPARATESLKFDDLGLRAAARKRLLVIDKGSPYVIIGAIVFSITGLLFEGYEFYKDFFGDDWEAELDEVLDQSSGG
jgi:hypothetical protein